MKLFCANCFIFIYTFFLHKTTQKWVEIVKPLNKIDPTARQVVKLSGAEHTTAKKEPQTLVAGEGEEVNNQVADDRRASAGYSRYRARAIV